MGEGADRWELVIQSPPNVLRRYPLTADACTLGRARENDLCYPDDSSLSRNHLEIRREGEVWWVQDLGSKNGTLLNGTRLAARQAMKAQDRLAAGQLLITLVDHDRPVVDPRVQFVAGPGMELHPSATVMTSLEGLLSGEITGARDRPAMQAPASTPRAFDSPAVRALIRAVRELSLNRPLEQLFELVLELSIQNVGAERGVLMTLDGDRLVSRAVHGENLRISTAVRDRVVREKASLLVRSVAQEEALRQQQSIFQQQISSLMAVPLQTDDRVIGLVYVDSRDLRREFTPDDLSLLTVLANVGAIGIEQELYRQLQAQDRLRQRDLQQAAEIQRGILPTQAPRIRGVDLAGYNAACQTVGGDYYDFIPHDDGAVTVLVGDVAGKGMSAAMLMSNLQARVQVLTEGRVELNELMTRLNRSIARSCPANRFITLFAFRLEHDGRVVFCNAGHNPALLVRASGKVETLAAPGCVLGILPEFRYEQHEARLEPGDLLAVYSDGVTETADAQDEEFGESRLAQVLEARRHTPSVEVIEAVNAALLSFGGPGPAADDVTLVVARRLAD